MEWIDIRDQKPEEAYDVLVSSHITDDPMDADYFVARYWTRENEWMMHLNFHGENAPYMKIRRPIFPADKWTYIKSLDY